ncbi:substrate-binding domain-containing protein [Bradyrhizobium sp. AS23.2]|uniref:molybdate ABC transporter substrate-binding protein n=1 Tax=Bradyrhizobium sp. AS23.2 TaxID=1680155 RepID=UPI00093B1445|nr:substrate-binding domain-containing protein [Bradyrhizobium sp. AS23.2]
MFSRSKTLIALAYLGVFGNFANAGEIKVLSANVFTNALDDHFRDYERSSGNKVVFEYATAGKVKDRLQSGEQADVAIVTRPMIDQLEATGKIARGTSVDLARSAVALVVRKGATKPDISSLDALMRALKSARSISYPNPARGGAEGVLITHDFDRLGLTDEIKSRTVFPKPGHFAAELVANGEAEVAIAQPMEALLQPGVEIVGLLPPELQSPASLTFSAGELANAKDRTTAHALIEYLRSAPVQSALSSKGMEPGRQ